MLPLFDSLPHKRPPVITALLIAANLVVFGYECVLMLTDGGAAEAWMVRHALVPARLLSHLDDPAQWLTVLSAMFLHGSVGHALGNCWFLWIFGNNVEDRLGHFAYLGFYLFAGVCAAGLQIAVGPGSALPMIGASGAIAGVLGGYLVLHPFAWIYTLVPWIVPVVPVPAFLFLVLWFFLQAYSGVGVILAGTSDQGGVAWWAHAGGFIAGFIMLRWAKPKAEAAPRRRR